MATNAQKVLEARRRAGGAFHSDAETFEWMLTPNTYLEGKTPLQALESKEFSEWDSTVADGLATIDQPALAKRARARKSSGGRRAAK